MTEAEKSLQALAITTGYREMPVGIDEFLDSDFYIHKSFPCIFPFWREKLREIFPNPLVMVSNIIVFTGSIGGKLLPPQIL